MTTPTIELDFDNIKRDIIAHFKLDPTFSDYNFEGSALNSIIDVLAYNTHTNSFYANMLHNEGFIDTAQKRSSVVSIAKELGYVPTSVSCSTAYIDLEVTSNISVGSLLLSRGSQFTSSNDISNHNFIVADDVFASRIDTGYKFTNIKLVSGILTNNTYVVNTLANIRSIFTIPNKNVDVSTIKVLVKESTMSTDAVEYTASKNVYELTATSPVFFIQESYDGYYQIYFGNDVLGIQPSNGNVITIEYIISNSLDAANECRTFSYSAGFNGELPNSTVFVTTNQPSFGGRDKESIESIRVNAVKNNSAKERAVSANDYSLILKNNFNFIKNLIVWGGETNVPPVYGKVFISIQPDVGYKLTDEVKKDVVMPVLKKHSVLTITPVIVDPDYISIEFVTNVKFNKFKTNISSAAVAQLVKDKIQSHMDTTMSFSRVYLRSVLSKMLLELDPGIVSVEINSKIGFNIPPLTRTSYEKILNNTIVARSIKSDTFDMYYNNSTLTNCYIKEIDNSSTTANGYSYSRLGIYSSINTLVTDIGNVNLTTGEFKFVIANTITSDVRPYIGIRCNTVSADVKPLNNQILIIDSSVSATSRNDNLVYVENYV